jgi:membrane fusion protein (multidrug efflux system)
MNKDILVKIKNRIPQKARYLLLGVVIALLVTVFIVGIKAMQFGSMMAAGANMVMPPEKVNVIEVGEQQWNPRISSVGTVTAVQGTVISAEAEGIVRAIKFEGGSVVKAGDVLVELDAEIERAQLRSAEAANDGAELTYKRAKELVKSGNISEADYSNVNVSLKQAQAQVDNIRAVIAKKTIRAPFSGKLGIRQISVGQFLNKGAPVVSLHSLNPVFVDFSLPQQRLGELAEGLTVAVTSDAYPNETFKGEITAFNPEIDPSTRNIRVQATLNNIDGRLRPGMFVTVDMVLSRSEKVIFIPMTAIQHATFGDSVYVVTEGEPAADGSKSLVVQQQIVRLGARQGDFVVATEGLKPGQRIVSTGVFKLRPGMGVVIDNTLAPTFTFTPTPDNT